MTEPLASRLRSIFHADLVSCDQLTGGCVADVRKCFLDTGLTVVAKQTADAGIEAAMLATLAGTGLPVPEVLHHEHDLLILSWVDNDGRSEIVTEQHAADLLAGLHSHDHARAFGRYGHPYDTRIGGLHQPNPPTASWVEFFRDHRLRFMARCAYDAGRLDARTLRRVESFATVLADEIDDPPHPSLIHGDVWAGNVLTRAGQIVALVDPAIYHAHHEAELAFITLFSTFGPAFFDRYRQQMRIEPGFAARAAVYNLYPLLVHVRLFGGTYAGQVESTLATFGC